MRAHFEEAEARFGVDWELLAAVAFIETRFGRVVSESWAGARGPMQFLPATWAAYGLDGDVHDPRDAVLGAANYLSASGAPRRERQALLRYNPVDRYADAVSLYAEQIRRDPSSYYSFYNWQVFVRTRAGRLMRLTGPGA
jgi:membrane-bound lytic murein transglycosylase B